MSASQRSDPRDPRDPRAVRRQEAPMPALETVPAASSTTNRVTHLAPARELLNFDLGTNRVDVRGWPAFASDFRIVGAINQLLVEPLTGKVRYVSITLIPHAAHDDRTNALGSVLVPVGLVRRLDDRKAVQIQALTSEIIASAPRLSARPITRADEDATLMVYGMATSRDLPADGLYERAQFDEHSLMVS